MQMFFFILWCVATGMGVYATFSDDWIVLREETFDINHGLFETCLYQKLTENQDITTTICKSLGLDKRYLIFVPAVMILAAGGVLIFSLISAVFLRLIGFRKLAGTILGVLNIGAGIVIMAASGLVITSPLIQDDARLFERNINTLINPEKVFVSTFFIAWSSGLLYVCSGMVALALVNRKRIRQKHYKKLYREYIKKRSLPDTPNQDLPQEELQETHVELS